MKEVEKIRPRLQASLMNWPKTGIYTTAQAPIKAAMLKSTFFLFLPDLIRNTSRVWITYVSYRVVCPFSRTLKGDLWELYGTVMLRIRKKPLRRAFLIFYSAEAGRKNRAIDTIRITMQTPDSISHLGCRFLLAATRPSTMPQTGKMTRTAAARNRERKYTNSWKKADMASPFSRGRTRRPSGPPRRGRR